MIGKKGVAQHLLGTSFSCSRAFRRWTELALRMLWCKTLCLLNKGFYSEMLLNRLNSQHPRLWNTCTQIPALLQNIRGKNRKPETEQSCAKLAKGAGSIRTAPVLPTFGRDKCAQMLKPWQEPIANERRLFGNLLRGTGKIALSTWHLSGRKGIQCLLGT